MTKKDKTVPKVYIIESLSFEDEHDQHYEGEIIHQILNLSNVDSSYEYLRTETELDHFLKEYERSEFRYLHISMHGSKGSVSTTLNIINLNDFVLKTAPVLDKRRLFLSCCSFATEELAERIFTETDCYSIVGFNTSINYNDAAIFWASFYHLMFNRDKNYIKHNELKEILQKLKTIYRLPIVYYHTSNNNRGFKEIPLE